MADAKPLRIAFMGTPAFAVTALEALHKSHHQIVAVYCQPPKPAGRGQQVQKVPVQIAAEVLGIEVRTPQTLRDAKAQETFNALKLDAAVVAAYGLILPEEVLKMPQHGCVNIHASLLPRWRGAAPIHRAIMAGDEESGITIMQMEKGLDTGPILAMGHLPMTIHTRAQGLHDELAALGATMIVDALDKMSVGALTPRPQPEAGVTYAAKLTRDDARIDWARSALEIDRQLRALNPWPGCSFTMNGETVKVLEAAVMPLMKGLPGELLDEQFTVACGEQALRLLKLQRPGKNPTDGEALLRGLRVPVGSKL